jgi:hypothetical protein
MLVALGRLTAIEWRGGRRRWPLRSAPVLAYESTLRRASLLIVYGPRRIGGASLGGLAEYARTHWGKLGDMARSEAWTLEGELAVLGPCKRVIYTTRKGSDELVDYDHVFGTDEGGLLERFTPPNVCTSTDRGVPRGTLQLAGGTYRVTSHGIVG